MVTVVSDNTEICYSRPLNLSSVCHLLDISLVCPVQSVLVQSCPVRAGRIGVETLRSRVSSQLIRFKTVLGFHKNTYKN